MAIPNFCSPIKPHFFQPLLPGFHHHLNIPVAFFEKHIQGKNKNKRAKLKSDVSYRTWEVKMDGRRFTGGWEGFALHHDFQVSDVIVFRHEGDLVFHVTGFGPSRCEIQYAPFCPDDHDTDEDEIRNASIVKKVEKNLKTETESSSDSACLMDSVTVAGLHSDTVNLPINFVRSSGLDKRCGKSSSGKCSKRKEKNTHSERRVPSSPRQNRFLTLTLKPRNLKEGKLRLPVSFTRHNGIVKSGTITLLDKHGVEWPTNYFMEKRDGSMYLGKGSRNFWEANGVKEGESFTLELIWTDTTPKLKFCSKIHHDTKPAEHEIVAVAAHQPEEAQRQADKSLIHNETQTRKRVRVEGPSLDSAREKRLKHQENEHVGASSARGRAENSRGTQIFSASDQVAEAKQKIHEALNTLRLFPEALVKEEQNLGVREFDAFGNLSSKKKVKCDAKIEAESSSDFVASVTASNLRTDARTLPISYARSNGLNNRCCEIVLVDDLGRSWTSVLKHKKFSGAVYIRRGWSSFCHTNGLGAGDLCTFRLVRNGAKPVLRLSPTECTSSTEECSEANDEKSYPGGHSRKQKSSKRKEKKTPTMRKASSRQSLNQSVTLTLTPNNVKKCLLRLPMPFTRENGFKKGGEIILVDINGVKWPTKLLQAGKSEQMSLGKGWKDFCKANGVKTEESFVLELIWEDTTPLLRFCSKVL